MKKKEFIITIDTEGDNLWNRATTKKGIREISTENARYIERFQVLCRKYDFYPTYLVDYEMIMDNDFVARLKRWSGAGECEVGMHMHAWNTPPIVELPFYSFGHNPYAGEYSHEILREKLILMTELISEKIDVAPKSHRGGRWYIDDWYVDELIKLGYEVDCSITPGVSWRNARGNKIYGPDYSNYSMKSFCMNNGLWQVPPTIIAPSINKRIQLLKERPYDYEEIMNSRIWLRPNGNNIEDMLYIVKKQNKGSNDYLEFMIHSSELMPGGSPTFKNEEEIEKLYEDLELLFEYIKKNYYGVTLYHYVRRLKNNNKYLSLGDMTNELY